MSCAGRPGVHPWRSLAENAGVVFTGFVGQQPHAELSRIVKNGGVGAGDARVALGDGPDGRRLTAAIRALAAHRGPASSTCPSDAARAVGGERWRQLMDEARDVARELAVSGDVVIMQRGTVLDPEQSWRGPIRIRVARR